jgi:hypothetical protein
VVREGRFATWRIVARPADVSSSSPPPPPQLYEAQGTAAARRRSLILVARAEKAGNPHTLIPFHPRAFPLLLASFFLSIESMHEKSNETLSESNKNESIALKSASSNGTPAPATETRNGGDNQTNNTDADGDVEMNEDGNDNDSADVKMGEEEDDERRGLNNGNNSPEQEEEEKQLEGEIPQEIRSGEKPDETPAPGLPPLESVETSNSLDNPSDAAAADALAASLNVKEPNTAENTAKTPAPSTEGTTGPTPTKPASETPTDKTPTAKPPKDAANDAPPPIMRGTFFYNAEARKHIIRGMWNFENSQVSSQRFELVRSLQADEEVEKLPMGGEFSGSFSLAYVHVTSSGKTKEKSKLVQETGVKITFEKVTDSEYTMTGDGTNQFGVFKINGTATPSEHEGDPVWNVVFEKRYDPSTAPPPPPSGTGSKSKSGNAAGESAPLPDPSPSYPTNVVCLRGTVVQHTSQDLGSTEMSHRISGYWATSLNFILEDPDNKKGVLSQFQYEHKSTVPSSSFPVSGKYSGWFDLLDQNGHRERINESNVTLKFKKNNAGYFNVEGKGNNMYGKYTITGTMTKDNVITIFRHFQPLKVKVSKTNSSQSLSANSTSGTLRRASSAAIIENPVFKLEDVKVPDGASEDLPDPLPQPVSGLYAAVSRGVLRMNDDGSHICNGKWALTRENFTSGQHSKFTVRLDALYVKEALDSSKDATQFPLDSAMYKGSFQLKKGAGRSDTVVDKQVVMRFRLNSAGSYNVYGRGINSFGTFNLTGTLIMQGKTGGNVELYRMYDQEQKTAAASSAGTAARPPTTTSAPKTKANFPPAPPMGVVRRESTRTVKLPSRLEDDDPSAQLGRIMDRCSQILRSIREKDTGLGAFFSAPVDPVALGIPTYYQIIKEPMDLRTIAQKMEANQISSPEEFARLMRLVFQNAIKFNEDPAHAVHQAARNLMIQFNLKFRDVERMTEKFRSFQKGDKKETKKKKKETVKPKTVREIRFEEAQKISQKSVDSMASLVAAAQSNSATVSRAEFSVLVQMIQTIQNQMVETRKLIASLSPDEVEASTANAQNPMTGVVAPPTAPSRSGGRSAAATAPEKKKATKRKAEAIQEPIVTPDVPLTLEEKTFLTDTINTLSAEHVGGVVQIIEEDAPLGNKNNEEIDLEIDQLSNITQRKLLRYVSKVSISLSLFLLRYVCVPGS